MLWIKDPLFLSKICSILYRREEKNQDHVWVGGGMWFRYG